jgi:FkbM family methyltransferase
MCGVEGKVFAFEPSPASFRRLTHNLGINGGLNVVPVNQAVSDENGWVFLREAGSQSRVLPECESDEALAQNISRVECICMDAFVFRDEHPLPSLLLIDVEGHGGKVLKGAKEVLRCAKPTILCEIHSPAEQTEIEEVGRPLGYVMRAIATSRKYPRRVIYQASGA